MLLLHLIALFMFIFVRIIICEDFEEQQVHCVSVAERMTSKSRGIEVELIAADRGDKIILQCRHCDNSFAPENDASVPRIWFERRFMPPNLVTLPSEVKLGVKAPITANRIYQTPSHQLVIQNFEPSEDGDVFECSGFKHQDVLPVKYFIDDLKPWQKGKVKDNLISGNWSDLRSFEERTLRQLSDALQELSNDLRPSVLMHWGAWSECHSCKQGSGRWWRRGRCRVIVPAQLKVLPYNLSALTCRSSLMDLVHLDPQYKLELLTVPDFVVYDNCECMDKDRARLNLVEETELAGKFHRQLEEGDSAQILCPRNSTSELVEWSKGLDLLTTGQWVSYGKRCRVRVDVLGTLLIENAEREVGGQFTCRSGPTMHRFLVTVQQKSILSSPEFQESFFIVTAVLFICFVIYLSYVCMLWFEPVHVRGFIIGQGKKQGEQPAKVFTQEELHLQPWIATYEDPVATSTDYEADSDDDEYEHLTPVKSCVSIQVEKAQIHVPDFEQ